MKNTALRLLLASPHSWKLQGELTMMSLSETWRSFEKKRPVSSAWQIDFSNVKQMDSAGVAFLLDCIRYAKHHKIKLEFLNLSSEVIELIETQGMLSLINPYFKEEKHEA